MALGLNGRFVAQKVVEVGRELPGGPASLAKRWPGGNATPKEHYRVPYLRFVFACRVFSSNGDPTNQLICAELWQLATLWSPCDPSRAEEAHRGLKGGWGRKP